MLLTHGARSVDELLDALHGRVTPHHRFMLELHLTQIEALDGAVATLETRLEAALAPFRAAVGLLTTMPGLRATTAAVLVAEMGDTMAVFPSAGHLVSWAGLCPRLDESAGKRRSTRARKGAPWLKTTLVQAAWAAVRVKRSGAKIAFVLVAKGVFVPPDGAPAGHPENHPEPLVAALGESFATLALPRWILRQVQSAVR